MILITAFIFIIIINILVIINIISIILLLFFQLLLLLSLHLAGKVSKRNLTEIKNVPIFTETTNNKPYANNEANNHDVNNSAPKTFAESNELSSFSQVPLTSSGKLKL